jgi:hypothetical protein
MADEKRQQTGKGVTVVISLVKNNIATIFTPNRLCEEKGFAV